MIRRGADDRAAAPEEATEGPRARGFERPGSRREGFETAATRYFCDRGTPGEQESEFDRTKRHVTSERAVQIRHRANRRRFDEASATGACLELARNHVPRRRSSRGAKRRAASKVCVTDASSLSPPLVAPTSPLSPPPPSLFPRQRPQRLHRHQPRVRLGRLHGVRRGTHRRRRGGVPLELRGAEAVEAASAAAAAAAGPSLAPRTRTRRANGPARLISSHLRGHADGVFFSSCGGRGAGNRGESARARGKLFDESRGEGEEGKKKNAKGLGGVTRKPPPRRRLGVFRSDRSPVSRSSGSSEAPPPALSPGTRARGPRTSPGRPSRGYPGNP